MTEAIHSELNVDDPWRQNRKTEHFTSYKATGHYLNENG
jgi:hypothetical protein